MLSLFRRLSKSTIGSGIIAIVGLLILIGFAAGGIQSLSLGGGGGLDSSTLASAGKFTVTDRDMSSAMQRRLAQVRQQNPEADYATLGGDFDPLLQSLIDDRALQTFADNHGLVLSKPLIDAEIANIPGVKGLNGKVSPQNYQAFLSQQRLSDADLRQLISGSILQRLLVTPAASSARVPVGVASPYASMLLEQRKGEVALIPVTGFEAGLNPTDAQVRQYYQQNRNGYVIPEQRILKLARVGPDQVAHKQASDQEIADYYKAHQDIYGVKDIRVISQAVVPDQKVADSIAQRARGAASFVEAVKPAGLSAEDVSVGPQTRQQFTDLTSDKVAAAVFDAKPGTIVGPIQSNLGWHVVRIESAKTQAGKSLAQARSEIATQITTDKRKTALADMVNALQDSLDGGSNFDEAAKKAGLSVTTTPPITASGTALKDSSYTFPKDLDPALKTGFELAPSDEPVVEQLAGDMGFALVAPAEVTPAAPAPLASIAAKVKSDWIQTEALKKAKAVADEIAAKARGKGSLADAVKQAGTRLPPPQAVKVSRLQLSQMRDKVPAPLKALFNGTEGKTKVGSDPQGRGFYIVKIDQIIPGNALNQPGLISEVQTEFGQPLAQEYAQEFLTSLKQNIKIRRNPSAIEATRKRITNPAG